MTDRLEAARAFVAAGDALNSPEHAADVEQLREISNRVTARQEAYDAAQEALFAADRTCKPADNAEAEAVLFGQMQQSTLADWVTPRPEAAAGRPPSFQQGLNAYAASTNSGSDEFGSSRANGAYAED